MKTKNVVLGSQFPGSLASTEENKELSSEEVRTYLTAESYGHKLKYSLHFLSSHACNKELINVGLLTVCLSNNTRSIYF